jgi:rubredoxin
MDGVIWLCLALTVAFVTVGAVVAGGRRRLFGLKKSSHCPNCETPMSLRRVSIVEALTLRGMWVCPHCGTRMRKRGNLARTAS